MWNGFEVGQNSHRPAYSNETQKRNRCMGPIKPHGAPSKFQDVRCQEKRKYRVNPEDWLGTQSANDYLLL